MRVCVHVQSFAGTGVRGVHVVSTHPLPAIPGIEKGKEMNMKPSYFSQVIPLPPLSIYQVLWSGAEIK